MGPPKALFSSAAVPNGELKGIEMGKRWVEEGKTEDLWCGSRVRGENDNGLFIAKSK
jgi:hypothetical protein